MSKIITSRNSIKKPFCKLPWLNRDRYDRQIQRKFFLDASLGAKI